MLHFIDVGLKEGAELVAGSADKPAFDKGYYVQPTILRVKATDTLAREEIFGPVLVILTYKDEDEAIQIANDTPYGLGGGVWSQDEAHATAVARRIRTGQVDINGAPFNSNAPFGGYKQSGNGEDIDAIIDFRAVFQQTFDQLAYEKMPSLLKPRTGKLGLQDHEKIFCVDHKGVGDIFDMRGINRDKGCMIVVRPDQYVANILPLDGWAALSAYFGAVLH